MMIVLHRRDDGTFVIQHNGYPYHVIPEDPLFAEVVASAEGVDFPPEPPPPTPQAPPPVPQPTRAQLMARLAELQTQIEALPE